MPYTIRFARERAPIVVGDSYLHVVECETYPHVAGLEYYTARGGRSMAVQFIARDPAAAYGPAAPPIRSPRFYVPIADLEPGATEWNLACFASHRAAPWIRSTLAWHWHRDLIRRCRPYRATHGPTLRAVARWMHGRYGAEWWRSDDAQRLALATLRRFGVAV